MKMHQIVLNSLLSKIQVILTLTAIASYGFCVFQNLPACATQLTESISNESNSDNSDYSKEPDLIEYCKESGDFSILPNTRYVARKGIGQRFHLKSDSTTFLMPEYGTNFYERRNQIVMRSGRLVAVVGKDNPLELRTEFGEVEVPRRSAAIIQYTEDGVMRVDNLQGKPLVLTFRVNYRPYTFSAEKGDELCAKIQEDVDKKSLLPNDGVDREQDTEIMTAYGCTLVKHHVDLKMLLEREQLLVCSSNTDKTITKRIAEIKDQARPLKRRKGVAPTPENFSQLAFQRRYRTFLI